MGSSKSECLRVITCFTKNMLKFTLNILLWFKLPFKNIWNRISQEEKSVQLLTSQIITNSGPFWAIICPSKIKSHIFLLSSAKFSKHSFILYVLKNVSSHELMIIFFSTFGTVQTQSNPLSKNYTK